MAIQQRAGFTEKREQIFAHFIEGRFCKTPFESASDTDALHFRLFILNYPEVS